ncbi:MAG: hypothetical protein AAF355_02095 [Myxococcota bacterium]
MSEMRKARVIEGTWVIEEAWAEVLVSGLAQGGGTQLQDAPELLRAFAVRLGGDEGPGQAVRAQSSTVVFEVWDR